MMGCYPVLVDCDIMYQWVAVSGTLHLFGLVLVLLRSCEK